MKPGGRRSIQQSRHDCLRALASGLVRHIQQGHCRVNTLVSEWFNRGEFVIASGARAMLNDPEWTREIRLGLRLRNQDVRSLVVFTRPGGDEPYAKY